MKLFWFTLFISLPIMAENISIRLKDAPTKETLTFLANEFSQNIVIEENIKSNVNLLIENSSFDKILNSISKITQSTIKKEDSIYFMSKKSENTIVSSSHKVDIGQHQASLPKLATKSIKLYYAKASEVIEAITKGSGNLLSENGYLHFDDRSNSIIIKDTLSSIKNISQLIKQLDAPIEQVAIEARIVTISSENLKELGVRWGMFSPTDNHHKFAGSLEGNNLTTNNLNVNFPVSNAASAVLQVATINSRMLDLELTALERENSIEIIASPRLLTTNKKGASIKQGTEIPYAIYDKKSETTDVEFKEAVLGLEVTPHLSEHNQVLLDMVVTQNAPNTQNGFSALTTIDKQELKTQVFAKDGETIVLGGVFQHLITKGEDKVPVLGSIPVLKHLFSQSRDKISKRELVIFVTPHIIKSPPIQLDNKKSKQK
ncbi:type IV pilus secretin PilQ [Ursidibacter maritimus]|uniref:Type IV pilus secretin PilQ n=1 Tax=Ursidibacter maritimus TaxID=1331689 RepID=A0A949T2D0_9PAST|nr:type IV pilus secretin PilQ [Ursidibacter maritimus]KAE9540426.1 secretin [Ursidibacter maritimus]MBV6524716.1 type IV pilus secretin PilQ [Ursidibacter maritimus]MBV6525014.1 type IV pilus secretin PilQ [Ursidibacter maritimus]MBV6527216.1 type IV pilus secretin PilQ [Ursidibacter maritimus]MBV6530749.1 type IV pilus secretin PilQ [Ursidibacter maritimus]